jgi:hypothetical protein
MIVCAVGDIHGALDRLYADVLDFEAPLGVRFEWVAIVDRVVFTRVRALRDAATTRGSASKGRNPGYILRGVLFCACCGSAFPPASTRKNGWEFRYYRCVKRDKQGSDRYSSRQLPARVRRRGGERRRALVASGQGRADPRRGGSRLLELGEGLHLPALARRA